MIELSISTRESIEEVAELEEEWRQLHADCSYQSVFNGFDFFMASISVFPAADTKLYVLVATGVTGVAAIFPFQRSRIRNTWGRLWQLEYAAQWESDKLYPLIRRGFEEAAWLALAQYLSANRAYWDRLQLVEIPEGLAATSALQRAFRPPHYWVRVGDDNVSPIIGLDRPWSERWQGHRKMRKKVARMQNAFGDRMRFQVFDGKEDWRTCIGLYLELESKGWKAGRVGIGKDEYTSLFYWNFLSRLAVRNGLRIGILFIDDTPVAAEIAYVEGSKVYFSHGTYDESFSTYSPGMVSTCLFLQYFHDGTYVDGDFLAGYAGYMTPWADRMLGSRKLQILRISPRLLLLFPDKVKRKLLRRKRNKGRKSNRRTSL
jgi:hypothetical protein